MHRANAASRSKVARKAAVTDRLEELLAEIKAINAWDLDYLSRKATERIDYAAWTARRLRLTEIHQELGILLICLDIPIKSRQN
jgi:hypothetical protein